MLVQVSPKDKDLLERPMYIMPLRQTSGQPNMRVFVSKNGFYRRHSDMRMLQIVIAERILKRPFKKGECSHHFNGIVGDCRRKNLLICTQSYHAWLHQRMAQKWMKEHIKRPIADTPSKEVKYKGV